METHTTFRGLCLKVRRIFANGKRSTITDLATYPVCYHARSVAGKLTFIEPKRRLD
jgi:hypothetical protein